MINSFRWHDFFLLLKSYIEVIIYISLKSYIFSLKWYIIFRWSHIFFLWSNYIYLVEVIYSFRWSEIFRWSDRFFVEAIFSLMHIFLYFCYIWTTILALIYADYNFRCKTYLTIVSREYFNGQVTNRRKQNKLYNLNWLIDWLIVIYF